MVTLPAAFGVFHVTQQAVHFRDGQPPIGANRAMTGHGPEQLVHVCLHPVAGAVLHQIRQHIADQPIGLGLLEQRRDLADRQGFRAKPLQLEAQALKRRDMFFSAVRFTLADRERLDRKSVV